MQPQPHHELWKQHTRTSTHFKSAAVAAAAAGLWFSCNGVKQSLRWISEGKWSHIRVINKS